MHFITETESAAMVDQGIALAVAKVTLIAACSEGAANFPVVIGHGSSALNRFTVKAAASADLAGFKVDSFSPGSIGAE